MAITLIVKATRRCNIRCVYCHDWRDSGPRVLSFRNLARLTKEALEQHDEVSFIWHGGEPLLLGMPWFERALALQQVFRRAMSRITNSIQTNACLLTGDWIEFLLRHRIAIGVSVDGPAECHDRQRVDGKSRGTYRQVMRGLSLARNAGVPHGVLVVVSDDIVKLGAERTYRWLKDESIQNVGFLPQRPDPIDLAAVRRASPSSEFLGREVYGRFLSDIASLWWQDDASRPNIRELQTFLTGLIAGSPGICIYQGSCVGKYFGIDPNGDVYHCDRYIPEQRYRVGNLSEQGPWIQTHRLARIAIRAARGEKQAQACKWYSVCHGGCPHDRHADASGWHARNHCCGSETVLSNLANLITASLPPELRASPQTS